MIVKKKKELKKILAAALVLTLLGAVPGTGAWTAVTKAHAAAGAATPGNISREESGRSRRFRVREEDPEETGLKSATPGNAERDEDLSYEEPASWGNYISEDGYVVSPAEELVVSPAEEELVVSPAEAEYPAFEMSETIDGIRITVTAEEGAFPADAVLVVERVPVVRAAQAEEAVAEQRPEGQNVAVSYTFDIRVEDQEGTELQPADGSRVNVAFAAALVADSNLETNVYHITEEGSGEKAAEGLPESEAGLSEGTGSIFGEGMETAPDASSDAYGQSGPEGSLTAEKLEVELDEAGETAVVETDGFSLYTVEFTYNDLQFVMTGGTEIPLSVILEALGLQGEASAVEVSDETLFSAEKKDGEWVVLSKKAFTSEEWMKVTISDIVYEIVVTDATTVNTWEALQAACTAAGTDIEIELTGNVTADPATATSIEIPSGKNVTIDLKGYTIDRNHNSIISDGTRSRIFGVRGNLTLKDTSSNKTGKITGAYFTGINGTGVFIYTGGTFTMNGGTIYKNEAYGAKGGGVYVQSGATFIMNSGAKLEHDMGAGNDDAQGGGVYVASGGSFTMNGGDIYDCWCGGLGNGARGGGIYVANGAAVKIYGGSITNNDASIAGGGIYLEDGAEIELKQNVTISGNTINGGLSSVTASNIYVGSGAKIKLTGNLTGSTPIGITTADTPEEGSPVYFADSNSSYFNASKFSSDDSSCYIAVQNSKLAVVKKTALTVSGITASNKTYDGTTAATLSFSNVVYKHNGTTVTPSGISVSATGAFNNKNAENGKTVTISGLALSGSGTATYRLDTANSQSTATANITKKAVTVSGITASNKTYDGNTAATLVTSGASFAGILNGDTLTVSGTGTFNNANAGDNKTVSISNLALGGNSASNYSISSTSQTSTTANIEKLAVTVKGITASNKTYDGNTTATLVTNNATFTGKLSSDTLTVSGKGTFNNANVGSRTVTISNLALGGSSAGNYSLASSGNQTSTSASITRRTVTVSGITASNKTYDGNRTATLVTTGASFAGIVSGETLTVGGTGTFDNKNAGTGKTVTISGLTLGGSSAGNYSVSSDSQKSTTADITKKTVGLTWTNTSFTYDGATHVPTATATGLVSGDSCRVTVTGAASDPGTHTATASELSNTNYQLPSTNTKSFTIGARTLKVVSGITAADKVYDGTTAVTLNASNAVLDGLISGDTVTVTAAGAFADADVGSKTVNITSLTLGGADAGKYALADSGNQTTAAADISRATLTVTADAKSKTYGDTDPALTYTAIGFKGSDTKETVMSGTLSRAAGENVGDYAISQGTLSAGDNYTISFTGATFTINKATLTVKAVVKSKTYGDTDPALNYTATGFTNGDSLLVMSGKLERDPGENTGNYAIRQGTLSAGNNYTISYTGANLTINPAPLTVTAEAKSKIYGDADPELTYMADGFKRTDTKETVMSGALERAAGENAGTYAISQGTLSAGNNYTISYTGANLTINPAPLIVTAEAKSKIYGDADPELTYMADGFKRTDTKETVMSGALERAAGENAGTYAISQGTVTAGNNYTISYTGADLTINRKEIGLSWGTTAFTYNGLAQVPEATATGLVDGDSCDVTVTGAGTDAGSYTATASALSNSNYKLPAEGTKDYTIGRAALSVTTPDAEKVYDGTPLSAAGSITGLVNSETATLAAAGTQTKAGSSTNAYSISWDGTAAEANYEIVSETLGTLTVTPKEVTVSGITAASKRYDRSAAAALNYDSVVMSGMVAGDDLSVRATGIFEDEKAGRDKTVNITGIILTGKDAANYKLAASGNQSSTTADITRISSGGSSGTTTVKGYVGSVGGSWNQDGSNWSYTYLDGHRAEGWNYLYYNGRSDWYYFGGAGLMQTGWINWEENRYYLNPVSDGRKGALLTGWQLIDGNWYYFEPVRGRNQGRMYRNESTPDGYTLGPDGAWTGSSGAWE